MLMTAMPGWTEWVEKGDQVPYTKWFLFQSPKAIRVIIQRWWEVPGRCRSSGKHWNCVWFKMGWGEKGIEESAGGLHEQWVRYRLKVGSLGSVSGLCFVLWP